VDDVLSLASRREKLQDKRKADIMSAAVAILGIIFATIKLRTSAKTGERNPLVVFFKDYNFITVKVKMVM